MLFCFNPKANPRIEKIQQFLIFKRCFFKNFSTLLVFHSYLQLGGVYMTPGRLSRRDEFTPVPSHGSTFVYMIPPQKVMPARVAPA